MIHLLQLGRVIYLVCQKNLETWGDFMEFVETYFFLNKISAKWICCNYGELLVTNIGEARHRLARRIREMRTVAEIDEIDERIK